MREFDAKGSSSLPPIKVPAIPEQTKEQKQQDAIAETQRHLDFAVYQLEGIQHAQDPRVWEAKHVRLQEEITTSTAALEKAQELQVDSDTLTALQTRLTKLRRAAAEAKPPERSELALEPEICAALVAKPQGSAHEGHHRKEMTLQALFQQLDVADSRALLWRIKQCLPEDKLVAAFHELAPARQAHLLETLADAGRREAVAAEPARRAALPASPEAVRGGVLHAGPATIGPASAPTPAPSPVRGLTATSEEATAPTGEVETLDTKLRRILEAGEPDDQVAAQLEALFGELDDTTRRALAQRFERYRQGSGDDIAARFLRLEPPVRRRLLGTLTGPARQAPARGPKLLTATASPRSTSPPFVIPGADHPARRGIDGEQVIQTDQTTEPGTATPIRYKSWKSLAEVAETVQVQDDGGDTLHIDITYRLESRPAEVGEVPDIWIHTERKALLTIGSGEHAGATIIGQARVHFAPDEVLDPKAAIAKVSVGADHRAQIYLAEAQQYVHLHGAGGRPSLLADAAESDVLAYDDPLRTLVGLKNILKQQHVAGRGADVAKMHARAAYSLGEAQRGRAVLEREIQQVKSYHDPHPGMVAPVRWLAGDIADWLAVNQQDGRDDTEDARLLRKAHGELLRLIDDAEHAKPPERDQLSDALAAPVRLVARTAAGLKEAGAMAVDAVVLGVNAVGKATGVGSFEYQPISTFGQAAQANGVGLAVVQLVNGFADEWSDAIERARHGDYRSLVDVSTDTLLMLDGARGGGMVAIDKGEAIAAKLGNIAKSARDIAGRLPAEAADTAMAMAAGADAFVAELRAGGMQMATAGGGPGPGIGGITGETLAKAAKAGGRTFTDERLSRAKPRAIKTIQQRLGTTKAPDVAEWITRVEAVFDGDAKAALRFLNKLTARVTEPAPFLRKVDILLALRNIAADDFAAVLSSILDAKISDPVAVLDDIEWVSTRPLSSQARSTLIRRAVKGHVDLDWVKRTRLTDHELEIMGQEKNMSFVEFEQASDIPSRRYPGHLVDRPPLDHGAGANAKIRGIAGELVARELALPDGLKIERRMIAGNTEPTTDFELRAPDGSVAELEAKALRPESWKEALDEYELESKNRNIDPKKPVARLLGQVKAGLDRGHKVYVAISDGTPIKSRVRLQILLKREVGVEADQLLLLPESEILRIGKLLREHMGIPQPTFPGKGGR